MMARISAGYSFFSCTNLELVLFQRRGGQHIEKSFPVAVKAPVRHALHGESEDSIHPMERHVERMDEFPGAS